MRIIIGITGRKRSGKGAVADFLAQHPDVGTVYQIGFADKLKRLAASTLGFEGNPRDLLALMDEAKLCSTDSGWTIQVQQPKLAVTSELTARAFLQNLGASARELFGENFWVDQILPDLEGFTPQARQRALDYMYTEVDVVAVTDVRYPNEAERIRSLGGVIWRVNRHDPGVKPDSHGSEKPLPGRLVDYEIHNNGSLEDLQREVTNAIDWTEIFRANS